MSSTHSIPEIKTGLVTTNQLLLNSDNYHDAVVHVTNGNLNM